LNIGYDAKRLFCNFTGLGNYSRSLVYNLQKHHPEHHFCLYTPKITENELTAPFINDTKYSIHQSKSLLKSYWRSFSIKKDLLKDGIQIYHGLSNELPLGLQKTNIKTIVTIHDLIFERLPETYKPIDRKIYRAKFKAAAKAADHVIAISEATKNDLITFYNIDEKKISVVYQNCHPDFYANKPVGTNLQTKYNIPGKYVLYLGTVEERKNLKNVIKAYQYIPASKRPPLVIIGKGRKYAQQVKQEIENLNLNDTVFWLNYIESLEDIRAFYQQAKVFIYPSVCEGFGLPVAEAVLSGTPVITSNQSSMPEAAGPGAKLISPDNPQQIAQALTEILDNEELKARLANDGRAYALKMFDPASQTQKLMDIYHQLLQA